MNGLSIRLGEGSPEAPKRDVVKPADSRPISDDEAAGILNRLPVEPEKAEDKQAFSWPPQSPPAPRTGKTVEIPFPPAESTGAISKPEPGPLEVLRRAPEGDVPIAPGFSLTFSQPMVPLTSISELEAKDVPVHLSPLPQGKWRWVGTRTLVFDVDPRFPMATVYQAEVPAGVKSAVGGVLPQTVQWEFKTPAPTLASWYPASDSQPLQPVMFASFDQRIDPAEVIKKVRIRAGSVTFEAALVGPEELKEEENVKGIADRAEPGRWLAFKTIKPLPVGSNVDVLFEPGLPSAEGPLVTAEAQGFKFETYGPLRYLDHGCSWGTGCPPLRPLYIRFTNPLDRMAFDPSWVKVEPAVEDLKIKVVGSNIELSGLVQGRTTYRVSLSPKIADIFGQTLGTAGVVTFKIGSAPPIMSVPAGEFMVLDPAGKPAISVFTINHERLSLRVFKVKPEQYLDYENFLRPEHIGMPDPPGEMVDKRVVSIGGEPDKLNETQIDLSPYLKGKPGHLIVEIQPDIESKNYLPDWGYRREPHNYHTWVQATGIAVDAVAGPEKMVVWTNALKDGQPLEGVEVALLPGGSSATSGKDGLAEPALPDSSQPVAGCLVAKKGDDSAVLRQNEFRYGGHGGWRKMPERDELRWYVFDDRQMYRPGETVKVKGWIRMIGGGTAGDVGPLPPRMKELTFIAKDSRNNDFARGTANINAWGGFDLSLNLPVNLNLGGATLALSTAGSLGGAADSKFHHEFQVQEFRRPEFEVTAKVDEGPFFVLGSAVVTTSAKYYAGGALPNADVTWEVRSRPGYFSPPGWDGFVFGVWRPWWRHYDAGEKEVVRRFEGKTDALGEHCLKLDFEAVNPPEPTSVLTEATVMDVNRQAWTAEQTLLVHPADEYVGIKMERSFVQAGEPFELSLIVTDLDGKAISGQPIDLKVIQEEWDVKDGGWQTVDQVRETARIESGKEPVAWSYKPKGGGTYRIEAEIKDAKGRSNRSVLTRWVGGGQRPPERKVTSEEVMMIPDKQDYQAGQTAEILIQAPFWPAEGLVTLARSGIVDSFRITLDGPTYTLKVPIIEAYIPNIHVRVDLAGDAFRVGADGRPDEKLPKRPAYGAGELNLSLPPLVRTLSLSVEPKDKKLDPGGQTSVELKLTDASGKPVKDAEVALVVVDEAVLALTGYELDDPVGVFYSERPDRIGVYRSRDNVILASLDELKSALDQAMNEMEESMATMNKSMRMMDASPVPAPAPMAAGAAPGESAQPIKMRQDFNALAHFAPEVRTDAEGKAVVPIKLPDNLTRYRIMAVAVADGKYFGLGEAAITARLPLMVRPSAPRFLNFGDKFELPVTVQNQTDDPMSVDVAVRASNAILTEGAGRSVTVPANDRVEIRFPAKTDMAGKARFQIAAVSGPAADAAEVELPVYTPATAEAFAVYGEIDDGTTVQPVQPPADVYPQFGGLTVTTSSTALQTLTDAVIYLVDYPFGCSEQIASRVLSIAALRDVMTAFEAEGLPPAKDIEAGVLRDLDRLRSLQNYDGGFPIWERGRESWPYYSIHVAHALVRAKAKGYPVDSETLQQSLMYLKDIRNHIPESYFENVHYALEAYALYVRNLAGDPDCKAARALLKKPGLEKLTPEEVAWLYGIIIKDKESAAEAAAIKRYLNNRAVETAGAAGFVSSYSDGDYLLLHSSRRTDAIVLEALIKADPKNDLIPKIVRGLLGHRTKGRWGNTQENTFVLLAMDAYFRKFEAVTPDFLSKVWIGEKYAGQTKFKGRTTEYQQISVPMDYLAGKPPMDLIVSKEGAGRMYYRLGLRYAPTDLNLKPADYGFAVTRIYEAVDDPADVRRDEAGAWHIRAGSRVRVKLTLAADFRRYHVALIDPLPAGFEALNPALAMTGSLPEDESQEKKGRYWWWGPWYEHQNLRDDRAEAFTPLLWEGVYDYSYVARATTPGVFIAPPTRAEEMYAPETFGRSGTDIVIVK